MRLRVTFYYVGDLVAATEAYSKLLGLSPYYSDEDWVRFRLDGGDLALHLDASLLPHTRPGPVLHGAVASLSVDDIGVILEIAQHAGFQLHGDVQTLPYGMQARILDLWGNHISILQPMEA
jgi:predicted enzyme related to lactoylglutathione lyase